MTIDATGMQSPQPDAILAPMSCSKTETLSAASIGNPEDTRAPLPSRLILARLLLPLGSPSAYVMRLEQSCRAWLDAHHCIGQIESDEHGCWLHAHIGENTLICLQNDVHHNLQIDVFVGYIAHGWQDPSPPSSGDLWRQEIHDCALAAALAQNTYPVLAQQQTRSLALQTFRHHVEHNRLTFEAQPILRLSDFSASGYELLARMPGIPTMEWIAHVINSHDAVTMAKLALQRAQEWLGDHPQAYVSVNLTPCNFLHPFLHSALDAFEPDIRRRLVLELTEWHNPGNTPHLPAAIDALRQRGVRVAIDDFGAGYSSTHVLRTITFDIIKIDMSLVQSTRRSDHDLIRWAVSCADEMGAVVVAEGIETEQELRRIEQIGIAYGQGWHLDRIHAQNKDVCGRQKHAS